VKTKIETSMEGEMTRLRFIRMEEGKPTKVLEITLLPELNQHEVAYILFNFIEEIRTLE
jgi:hypothetical protein